MDRAWVRDAALLILRLVLGVIFIAHGWDKVMVTGMAETAGQFGAMGVPQPTAAAWAASVLELIGGALLVLGLLTTAAAAVLAVEMLAAFWFAHAAHGVFATQGGGELVAVLAASLLVLIVFGAGRASLDRLFS